MKGPSRQTLPDKQPAISLHRKQKVNTSEVDNESNISGFVGVLTRHKQGLEFSKPCFPVKGKQTWKKTIF